MRPAPRTITWTLRRSTAGALPSPLPLRPLAACRSRGPSRSAPGLSRSLFTLRDFAAPASSPPPSGVAELESRGLICVHGRAAAQTLQGLITNNIFAAPDNSPRRTGFYAAFLAGTGRVLHDVFIYPDTITGRAGAEPGLSFLIEVDSSQVDALRKHITRYKLRNSEFSVDAIHPDEAKVFHAWDDTGLKIPEGLGDGRGGTTKLLPPVRDPRSPTHGFRLVSLTGTRPASWELEDLVSSAPWLRRLDPHWLRSPSRFYRRRRFLHGIAEGQDEILRDEALPAEFNMDLAGAIDWRKGCYIGQELTIRTHHRGVVRKRLLPCRLYLEGEEPPALLSYRKSTKTFGGERYVVQGDMCRPLTKIGRDGTKKAWSKNSGEWVAGQGNVGVALCRLGVMTDAALSPDPAERVVGGQQQANGKTLPGSEGEFHLLYSEGEFPGLVGEETTDKTMKIRQHGGNAKPKVKVKAFVPEWLEKSLLEQNAAKESRQ